MGKLNGVISTNKLSAEMLRIHKEELLALIADADSYYNPYAKTKKRADGSIKERVIEPSYEYLKRRNVASIEECSNPPWKTYQ